MLVAIREDRQRTWPANRTTQAGSGLLSDHTVAVSPGNGPGLRIRTYGRFSGVRTSDRRS